MAKKIETQLVLDNQQFLRALNTANQRVTTSKRSMVGAFAAVGAGIVAVVGTVKVFSAALNEVGNAVRYASNIEDLRIRLDTLAGSAEKGAAVLDLVKNAAKELPFDLKAITNAVPSLVPISDTFGDLNDNIKLTADLAAVSGLSFEETAMQLQRAFSAGASSADLFRERGVLAMAGFEAGVSYTVEETQAMFAEFGKTIEGTANQINDTLTGSVSQFSDRMDALRESMGAPLVGGLTEGMKAFTAVIDENMDSLIMVSHQIGVNLLGALASTVRVVGHTLDFIVDLKDGFMMLATAVYETAKPLIDLVQNVLSKLNQLLLEGAAAAYEMAAGFAALVGADETAATLQKVAEGIHMMVEEGKGLTDVLVRAPEALDDLTQNGSAFGDAAERIAGAMDEYRQSILVTDGANKDLKETQEEVIDSTTKLGNKMKEATEETSEYFEKLQDATKNAMSGFTQHMREGGSALDFLANKAVSAFDKIADSYLQMALDEGIKSIGGSLFSGGGGGGTGDIFGAIGDFFGGFFNNGGTVPGPRGKPRMILAHGGETVLPTHRSGMGGTGDLHVQNVNNTFNITTEDYDSMFKMAARRNVDYLRQLQTENNRFISANNQTGVRR
jgi:methyl-accepting chemotaxis protein